ncbi:MAG: PKD domain-containing protein [Acidobacteria bacterium]|nr:PKD domain-containing protein [Acidobacteriota bacterium]
MNTATTTLAAGPVAFSGSTLGVTFIDEARRTLSVGIYDEDFNTIAAPRLIADRAPLGAVALLWNGTDFGLFYRADDRTLALRRLSATGDPIGDPILLSLGRSVVPTDELSIVWSPTLNAYILARTFTQGDGKDTAVLYLGRDGAVQRSVSIFVRARTPVSHMRVAVTDSGIIGVFFDSPNGTLMYARIVGDVPTTNDVWTPADNLVVAASGEQFVLAHLDASTSPTTIRRIIIDTNGNVVSPESQLVAIEGSDVVPLALVNGPGDELALSYTDVLAGEGGNSLRLRRFTRGGATISDTIFAVADALRERASSSYPFVWTGRSYVTAVSRARSIASLSETELVRYCPLVAHLTTARAIVKPNEFVTFNGSAAGGGSAYAYSWDFGDRSPRATGTTVQHRYEHTGHYVVTLTVTDETGTSTQTTFAIDVSHGKQRAVRR